MTTPTTLAEWEAEKARIDELRKAAHRGAFRARCDARQSKSTQEIAEELFPYPSKPEKTVTLYGCEYRYEPASDAHGERFARRVERGWFPCRPDTNITPTVVRLLASLLPENDP